MAPLTRCDLLELGELIHSLNVRILALLDVWMIEGQLLKRISDRMNAEEFGRCADRLQSIHSTIVLQVEVLKVVEDFRIDLVSKLPPQERSR